MPTDFKDGSAGWPGKIPAAEQVQVQMGDRLAGALLAINHESVTIGQSQLPRQLGRDQVQVTDQVAILRLKIGVGRNHFPWNEQYVDRRLRIDVMKGDALLVFVDQLGGNLLIGDLQEEIVRHHGQVP
jgi:hypothetical protein